MDMGFDIDVFEQLCKVDSHFCSSLNNKPHIRSRWPTFWGGVLTVSPAVDVVLGSHSSISEEIKYTDSVKAQKELEKKIGDLSNKEFNQIKVIRDAIELKKKQIDLDCQKIDNQQKEINKKRDEIMDQKEKTNVQKGNKSQLQVIESEIKALDEQQKEVDKLKQNVDLQQKEIELQKEILSNLNNRNVVIEKYNNLYVKLEKVDPKLLEFTNEMCNYSTKMLSRSLAIEYLSIYWNKYKSVLESSLHGEVNHEMLNFEEFKKLMNIVDNIKDKITELDLSTMFRASNYIIVKNDPSVQAIRGVLVIPMILKQKTLPVYRPLILKTTGKPYYKLPDIIALVYLNNRYQIFNINNECIFSQNVYLCSADTYAENLGEKIQIEKFLNNEEHMLEVSIVNYNQNYSVGMHGIYVKSGTVYLSVLNTNGVTSTVNHTCKTNEFISFEDFDTIIIEDPIL
ncbi:uncharacterized protein LOC126325814 [Schistocerca gregaria]|uniref:uncharacterized protein LOC126325814 n=1 Tax=Schistocerca gregaria TaxID=7010 RepID=UPI00211E8F38|nr:uncharacterized protein LOC126325814 [Schistocerca gregaria]